jgi:hypothetical protein
MNGEFTTPLILRVRSVNAQFTAADLGGREKRKNLLRDESGAIGRNCQATVSVRSVTNMESQDTPENRTLTVQFWTLVPNHQKGKANYSHYISMCHHPKKKREYVFTIIFTSALSERINYKNSSKSNVYREAMHEWADEISDIYKDVEWG